MFHPRHQKLQIGPESGMKSHLFIPTLIAAVCLLAPHAAFAQKIQLKDGRVFNGRFLLMTGVVDSPVAPAVAEDKDAPSTPILLIDDELRRVFVPRANVASIIDAAPENLVKINLWQKVATAGQTVGSVGPSIGITPFDEFGRRIYEMQTRDGQLAIVQGITELTPRYTKVQGLMGAKKSIVWDMRIGTTSIPKDKLTAMLAKGVSHDNPQDWLEVVRFYLQAERFGEASQELDAIIKAFPNKIELAAEGKQIRQMGARRILREIKLRREAGQHELVAKLLEGFPTEDIPGDTLQQVREALSNYQAEKKGLEIVAESVKKQYSELASDDMRALVRPIADEIYNDLNFNNVDRLLSFTQLIDDASLTAEQKLSLAISGWLMGQEQATQEFGQVVPLIEIRNTVRKYLLEPEAHKRADLLASVTSMEGLTVPRAAAILAQLVPPWPVPKEAALGDGAFELTAPGQTENGDFRYLVQLPQEYDPYRKYPTLVVLNGAYNSPEQELEYWAGPRPRDDKGIPTGPRQGQSMRHGYIVVAVDWLKPKQFYYEFSLREHEAVLTTLRDACRRFSIDSERTFISGHGIGGDGAWDFASSHPDLWAGAIPFLARLDQEEKFIQHYWENAFYVPLYFVGGSLDGTQVKTNAQLFDQYLGRRIDGEPFNATVVEYHGRGYEPYHDEILNIFDWLGRQRRDWPTNFSCNTMREWDNFFWWVEGIGFPDAVTPGNWPRRGARPTQISGRVLNGNKLSVRSAADQTIVWLRPEVVDFDKPIKVEINGKRAVGDTEPSLEVLLEDARTRGDRQRPYWAKVQLP
jgi:pimeloyl-ACP methyl ester carboxylesterase